MKILAIIIGSIMILLSFIGTLCYNILVWGIVFYKFWAWFVQPVFIELPSITYLQAIGLTFFISIFKLEIKKKEDEDKKNTLAILIFPWMILIIGLLFSFII